MFNTDNKNYFIADIEQCVIDNCCTFAEYKNSF